MFSGSKASSEKLAHAGMGGMKGENVFGGQQVFELDRKIWQKVELEKLACAQLYGPLLAHERGLFTLVLLYKASMGRGPSMRLDYCVWAGVVTSVFTILNLKGITPFPIKMDRIRTAVTVARLHAK